MGVTLGLEVLTDSTSANGIATRRGLGKVRHIDTCQLWVQHEVHQGNIKMIKVKGVNNLVDTMTKYLGNQTLNKLIRNMHGERRSDRHYLKPIIARDEEAKTPQ